MFIKNEQGTIVNVMNADRNRIEDAMLHKALSIFHNNTGLKFNVEGTRFVNERGGEADAFLRLAFPGTDRQFVVEIKARLTRAVLLLTMDKLANAYPGQQCMIITEYVNPVMAERLRDHEIAFIDLAGNAYVNLPPVFIYIKGNKPEETLPAQTRNRAFQGTGLKMIFALINNPALVNAPYRDIAKTAKVALGTVGWVFKDLRDAGYLVDMGKRGKRIKNKKQLIERWVTAYPEVLKPKITRGHYTAKDYDWWQNIDIREYKNACWGGEVAAAKMTRHLKPELITVYTPEPPGKLLIRNKLKKDPAGEIEILDVFWNIDLFQAQEGLAPPLLVYADLIATGDARNLETAKLIYERDIAGFIGED